MPSLPLIASMLSMLFISNLTFFASAFQLSVPHHRLENLSPLQRCNSNTRLHSISNNNDSEDETTNKENEDEQADATNNNIFAALPAIGTSSFWDRPDSQELNNASNMTLTSHNIVVSRKLQLSYTCKLCDTHNTHSITRLGYNHGVVIAVCKNCHGKHLIADNLGWSNYLVNGFDYDGGERNIEEYVRNRMGEGDASSLRATRSVFDLENLWHEEKKDEVGSGGAVVFEEDGEDWS